MNTAGRKTKKLKAMKRAGRKPASAKKLASGLKKPSAIKKAAKVKKPAKHKVPASRKVAPKKGHIRRPLARRGAAALKEPPVEQTTITPGNRAMSDLNGYHWVPIQYREFWDVPRIFLVNHRGQIVLFDCPFNEGIEDYPDQYQVYLLPPITDQELAGSWHNLSQRAIRQLGEISVNDVRFDPSKRARIEESVLGKLDVKISANDPPVADSSTKF